MSEPQKGEIRKTRGGRVYYVQGRYESDWDSGPAGMVIRPVVSLTSLVEVEGQWSGSKFAIPTEDVEQWEVVSMPMPMRSLSEARG